MIITGLFSSLNAKTIVVNNQIPNTKDTNSGTFTQPFKSIQAGANQAQAGDTILVKAGIYREEVKPPRSGTKEKPITYLAAHGENVSIRGSERITSWKRESGLWLATIDCAMFGAFNPFTTNVTGAWLPSMSVSTLKYHLGDVYYKGEPFYEVFPSPTVSGV